jgi:DHA1 family tetracycline resistance protein-like MFS transporter
LDQAPGAPKSATPPVTPLSTSRRQAAMGFIFVTVFLDVVSLGIMIPVMPNLVREMVGGSYATATIWTGVFASCWGVMQFFFSPIQGMFSDRFGRRPILLISIFGLALDYLFMAFAPTLIWLFIGRMINGITAASFSTASAYVADITPPEDRARRFGLLGAAFGFGFIVGPYIGGELGDINIRLPFYVAAGMASLNWLYGLLILPESLPPERRATRFNWSKANPVGSFVLLKRHPDLLGMAGVAGLYQLAHNVLPAVFVLYVGQRYGWSLAETGRMMMAVGVANVIVQALLIGPAVKRLGERRVLLIGLVCGVTGMTIYGLAPEGWMLFVALPVTAFSAFVMPGLQGLMTRRVEPWEQGQLQGANSAIMALGTIVGPQIFTNLFAFSIAFSGALAIHGLPMYAAALFMFCGLLLALRYARRVAPGDTSTT